MFGSDPSIVSAEDLATMNRHLETVLDRHSELDSLGTLVSAMSVTGRTNPPIGSIAIGLDANVFLRLGGHARSADIVDYLDGRHLGPLILPGQAIQEFWNNQLSAVATISTGLRRKFDDLSEEITKIDPNFGDFAESMTRILEQFSSEYGYVYEESTVRNTLTLLEVLKRKAIVSYASRSRFQEMAIVRKRTKTPPGFKDDGDGDFFIWTDFLLGLLRARANGMIFEHAVLVTHDKKADWSRAGIAHPVLSAEVLALTGVTFDVWTIEKLYAAIST